MVDFTKKVYEVGQAGWALIRVQSWDCALIRKCD